MLLGESCRALTVHPPVEFDCKHVHGSSTSPKKCEFACNLSLLPPIMRVLLLLCFRRADGSMRVSRWPRYYCSAIAAPLLVRLAALSVPVSASLAKSCREIPACSRSKSKCLLPTPTNTMRQRCSLSVRSTTLRCLRSIAMTACGAVAGDES